jgi:hypothetical protein
LDTEGVGIKNVWGLLQGNRRALEPRQFATLADYTAATRQDQHSLPLEYDTGKAPDLGALEIRQMPVHYGPDCSIT